MEKKSKKSTRRQFIKQTSLVGAGMILANPLEIASQTNQHSSMKGNIKPKP